MNKKTEKIILFLGIIFTFFSKAGFVSALEVHYPSILGHSVNNTTSLADYVCYLANLGMSLAISITAIVIAFGGVYYLISYSRGKFTSEAKEWVKAGILGFLIVICADLIIYTINPNLTNCRFGILSGLNFNSSNSSIVPPGVGVSIYKEIPIGTLTETLLTKTMDCYGFDQEGNPVDGDTKTSNVLEPTYKDYDRVDCVTKLIDGAQKKARVVIALSNEVTNLMNQCSCGNADGSSKCNPTCGGQCSQPATCPATVGTVGTCTGSCVGGACGGGDCCPAGVKDKIEHGPIDVAVGQNGNSGCQALIKQYNGLDEFRCPNPISGEHSSCDDIISFVEPTAGVINQNNWKKINLVQQMIYFKEKLSNWTEDGGIQNDINALNQAKSLLESPQCYLAIPYVDILKTHESTKKQDHIILTQKFTNPANNAPIDVSKYCRGFNYANSSCFKKCNDACPDASDQAMQFYQRCSNPNNRESCIKEAYKLRPCIYGDNASKTFEDCITSCQNNCSDDCAKKYPSNCSAEYASCMSQCDDSSQNSKCILDNASSCLFGAEGFVSCANPNRANDPGNKDYCINNAYLCKNGSDNYTIGSPVNCSSSNNCSSWNYCHPFPNQTSCENANCVWYYSGGCGVNPLCQNQCANANQDNQENQNISKCPTCPCVTGTQCNEFSYNDDPLTFYCGNNWWENPNREGLSQTPIGAERVCPKAGEVPVGQMVDAVKNWATGLITNINATSQKIQQMIDQMKKIGDAYKTQPVQDYCKCNAKFDINPPNPPTPTPICKTGCQYSQSQDGEGKWNCICTLTPCDGSPCLQITTYLSQLNADSVISNITESRRNVIEKLAYSRKMTNECSVKSSAYGIEARLLNCTRVEDELISPIKTGQIEFNNETINNYCYGKKLGKIVDEPLTDNWFCCEKWSENQTAEPIGIGSGESDGSAGVFEGGGGRSGGAGANGNW